MLSCLLKGEEITVQVWDKRNGQQLLKLEVPMELSFDSTGLSHSYIMKEMENEYEREGKLYKIGKTNHLLLNDNSPIKLGSAYYWVKNKENSGVLMIIIFNIYVYTYNLVSLFLC